MKKKKLSSMELMSRSTELKVFGTLAVIVSMSFAIFLSKVAFNSSQPTDLLVPIAILLLLMVSGMLNIIRGIMEEIAEQSHARLVEDIGNMLLSLQDGEKKLLCNLRDEVIESLDSHGR